MSYLPTSLPTKLKIEPRDQELNQKNSLKIEVMRQNTPPGLTHELHSKIYMK